MSVRSARVLISDDHPAHVQELHEILKDTYETSFATSGEHLLEMAQEHRPHLILLGAHKGQLKSLKACHALRADPITSETPILFVRSHDDYGGDAALFEAGASDFLNRPLQAVTVRARVRTHVRLSRAIDSLHRLSSLDGLTGVANRRTFEEELEASWRRCTRINAPVSLVLLDVDYLKDFNRAHGPEHGDECLHSIAQALLEPMNRVDDLVARFRGGAFACLLPHTDEEGAEQIAGMLLESVRDLAIPHDDSQAELIVTVSAGVATEFPAASLAHDLVTAAEAALSEAKRAGRNRLHCAIDPTEQQLSVFRKKS